MSSEHRSKLSRLYLFVMGAELLAWSFAFIFPLFPVFLARLMSPQKVGGVMAICFLASGLAQPFLGRLLDAGWHRGTILFSILAVAAGAGSFLVQTESIPFRIFSASLFLLGTATLQTITNNVLEGKIDPESRPFLSTLNAASMNLGMGIAAVIAFYFLSSHQSVLIALDILTTILLGAALMAFKPKTAEAKSAPMALAELASAWRVLLGIFLFYLCLCAPISSIPLLFERMGHPLESYTTVMIGTSSAVVGLLSLVLLKPIERSSFTVRAGIAAGATALGQLLVPWISGYPSLIAVTTLWSIGEIFSFSTISVSVYEAFPETRSGLASGVRGFIFRSSLVVCPLIAQLTISAPVQLHGLWFGIPAVIAFFLLLTRNSRKLSD